MEIVNAKRDDIIKPIKIEKSEKSDNIKGEISNNRGNRNLNIRTYSGAKISNKNYKNMPAYELEKEVSDFIIEKNSKNLQNMVFFLNLKLPKINNKEEIELQSVRFLFSEMPNVLYGLREIDICDKNKDSRVINKENILSYIICYTLCDKNFKEKIIKEIDISFEKNSINFLLSKKYFSKCI